jgi:hypothetical protein
MVIRTTLIFNTILKGLHLSRRGASDADGMVEPGGRFVQIAVGAVPMRLGIAAEFATIETQAGAQVKVIEQLDRMLASFGPDPVGWLTE